ncbi:MAG: Lrp/AsnC family transcriptional regulator [Candidatus Margulisbacteria bacterium]|nr:Lrp/AsnC family transcriptional regulator [Candidatus Margulisiibacteriota bacterium]
MTQSDQNIIDLLQKNARFSNEDIAAQLGIEAIEVDTRIQSMLDAGIIRQFTTIINETKVDSPTTKALVELSIRPERNTGYDAIAHRICSYPEVESHHLVSGTYDFLLVVCGKTHKDIAHFVFDKLATIENVTSTTTHFIFKSYKEHGVLMDDHNESTRLAIMP